MKRKSVIFLVLTVIGLILFTAAYASTRQGRGGFGGECFLIVLPHVFYYIGQKFMPDILYYEGRKEKK